MNTVKDKLKFISKNTWLNFDDKFNFPIGRRSIIDRDPISRWGIGSDNEEKDGFYISRGFNTRKILEKYVQSKEYNLAFRMCPTDISQVISFAEKRKFMPPKSTWFHPKPLDGLICSEL